MTLGVPLTTAARFCGAARQTCRSPHAQNPRLGELTACGTKLTLLCHHKSEDRNVLTAILPSAVYVPHCAVRQETARYDHSRDNIQAGST